MELFRNLISYFCDYDVYDNMLAYTIRDRSAKDVSIEQCDFGFIAAKMEEAKADKIFSVLQNRLTDSKRTQDKLQIRAYVRGEISLPDLFTSLSFKNEKFLDELKEKVNRIKQEHAFAVYYPVILNCKKRTQHPVISFHCQLGLDDFQVNKLYVDRDIFALLIAQQKEIEVADARLLYGDKIDELVYAIDAIHPSDCFCGLYELVREEFKKIFDAELGDFQNTKEWQLLAKAVLSFELMDTMETCFRDEMRSVEQYYLKDHIMPETIRRFLRLSKSTATELKPAEIEGFHLGSYQKKYAINRKQWELLQVSQDAKLLCVEGPPGTGKTTLLKEMIADILVKKADALLSVWDEPWELVKGAGKEIYRSPLGGENLNSIVISSTNNKAIDNIGLELLLEIPYFCDFAKTMEQDSTGPYSGSLCARLGNGKNIEHFYKYFFIPFCRYLKELSIDQVDENAAIESYRALRSKIDEINLCITELLELRKAIEPVCSWSEAEQRKEQLVNRRDELSAQKREIEQQITERQQAEDTLQKQMQELTGDLSELQKEQKDIDARLNALYTEQKEFEDTSKLKRFFKFLFPETAALLKKYVSSEQIRDFIQDERTLRASNYAQMKRVESQLKQKGAEYAGIQNEISKRMEALDLCAQESENIFKKLEMLMNHQSCVSKMAKELCFTADELMNMDAYQLRNMPRIVELRKECFYASLKLFEVYICLNREPIINNLNLFLRQKEGMDGGSFYSWCQCLYNGNEPYAQPKAALLRTLWETFFMCFPVVTTTLHSFRKSTFQLISDLFDILLVDESGQIVPYYALAPLYRARRAVFVGDVNQIEPIKNVPPGFFHKKYAELFGEEVYSRYCIDEASAQSYAAAATDYYEKVNDEACGVILNEHRRCEPAIMAFSNQYIYHNVLELKGENNQNKLFGANLVAFDIRGQKAAQHYNQAEIDACEELVAKFVKEYGEAVKKDIGIITPFTKQAEKLKSAIPGVEVGTVHVFQGAEKKYILFSSVIDDMPASKGLNRFVGGKGNLLNVAFSRAKSQFIFVGNLQAAKEADNYLKYAAKSIKENGKIYSFFDTDENEMEDDPDILSILAGKQRDCQMDEISRYLKETIPHNIIDNPRLHNEILNNLLKMAASSVWIISPWIGGNVVTQEMLDTMEKKQESGISIYITFGYRSKKDSLFNIDELVQNDVPWGQKDSAEKIRLLLALLGDKLKYAPPSHVKLLLVDDKYLFIGSLNWLFNAGKTQQREISCLITNPDMINYVKEKYFE